MAHWFENALVVNAFPEAPKLSQGDIVKFSLFCQMMSAPGARICQALWLFCESPAWLAPEVLEWGVEALTEPRESVSPLGRGRRQQEGHLFVERRQGNTGC